MKMLEKGKQWTLDRLNNDINHSSKNTVISCLKCNLKKELLEKKHFNLQNKLK